MKTKPPLMMRLLITGHGHLGGGVIGLGRGIDRVDLPETESGDHPAMENVGSLETLTATRIETVTMTEIEDTEVKIGTVIGSQREIAVTMIAGVEKETQTAKLIGAVREIASQIGVEVAEITTVREIVVEEIVRIHQEANSIIVTILDHGEDRTAHLEAAVVLHQTIAMVHRATLVSTDLLVVSFVVLHQDREDKGRRQDTTTTSGGVIEIGVRVEIEAETGANMTKSG
jgi:hypothetical protein